VKQLTAVTCLITFVIFGAAPSPAQQSKPIPVGVNVEAEGMGKGQGMWAQAANDLTPAELKTLESLILAEIRKQEDVKIVSLDYSRDFIGIAVVAAKIPNGNSRRWYYIASNVVTVAAKKGTDEFVTHDVVAADDLASLARSIGYLFATSRFRATLGLWK
jgi:hypothetical protein